MPEKYLEEYISTSIEFATHLYCPFSFANSKSFCKGDKCMGWISKISEDERFSSQGRCGMVNSTLRKVEENQED